MFLWLKKAQLDELNSSPLLFLGASVATLPHIPEGFLGLGSRSKVEGRLEKVTVTGLEGFHLTCSVLHLPLLAFLMPRLYF